MLDQLAKLWSNRRMDAAAVATTALAEIGLLSLALLHVYWAFGGCFPCSDEESLAATVVGPTPDGRMPGLAPCLAVAALLVSTALCPLMLYGAVPPIAPPFWLRVVGLIAAGVLLLRGAGGYAEATLRPETVNYPYHRLNRLYYSPAALLIGGALACSIWLAA